MADLDAVMPHSHLALDPFDEGFVPETIYDPHPAGARVVPRPDDEPTLLLVRREADDHPHRCGMTEAEHLAALDDEMIRRTEYDARWLPDGSREYEHHSCGLRVVWPAAELG